MTHIGVSNELSGAIRQEMLAFADAHQISSAGDKITTPYIHDNTYGDRTAYVFRVSSARYNIGTAFSGPLDGDVDMFHLQAHSFEDFTPTPDQPIAPNTTIDPLWLAYYSTFRLMRVWQFKTTRLKFPEPERHVFASIYGIGTNRLPETKLLNVPMETDTLLEPIMPWRLLAGSHALTRLRNERRLKRKERSTIPQALAELDKTIAVDAFKALLWPPTHIVPLDDALL